MSVRLDNSSADRRPQASRRRRGQLLRVLELRLTHHNLDEIVAMVGAEKATVAIWLRREGLLYAAPSTSGR